MGFSVAGFVVGVVTAAPGILGYVSSGTRDNPFIGGGWGEWFVYEWAGTSEGFGGDEGEGW